MRRIKASVGNHILFIRNGLPVLGYVVIVRQNSVVVKINSNIAEKLKYETNLTIVNHSKYKIVVEKGTVA